MSPHTLQALLDQSDVYHRNTGMVRRFGMLLGKGDVSRREHEAQQVLERMAQAGYLGIVPRHSENSEIRGTHMSVTVGATSRIQSRVGRTGRAHQSFMEDAVLGRWAILLHEASHQEMLLLDKPDALPGVSGTAARVLSDWSLGGWGGGGNYLMSMLCENFADAYMYMLMCRGLEGGERLDRNLGQMISERKQDERKADVLLKDMLARGEIEFLHEPTSIHRTYHTLERVAQQRQHWIDLDPDKLRAKAMELSRQGLMDTLDPGRLDDAGFPIGLALRRWSIPGVPTQALQSLMQVLGHSYLEGANRSLLEQSIAGLPNKYQPLLTRALPLMCRILDQRGARAIRMGQQEAPWDRERQFMTNSLWTDLVQGENGRVLGDMQDALKKEYAQDRKDFIEHFLVQPLRAQPGAGAFLGLRIMLENLDPPTSIAPTPIVPLKPR